MGGSRAGVVEPSAPLSGGPSGNPCSRVSSPFRPRHICRGWACPTEQSPSAGRDARGAAPWSSASLRSLDVESSSWPRKGGSTADCARLLRTIARPACRSRLFVVSGCFSLLPRRSTATDPAQEDRKPLQRTASLSCWNSIRERNERRRSLAERRRISSGGPSATLRPWSMNTTRVPTSRANVIS